MKPFHKRDGDRLQWGHRLVAVESYPNSAAMLEMVRFNGATAW